MSETTYSESTPRGSKSLLPLIIILLVVVLLLAGGIGYLLLSGGNLGISLPDAGGGVVDQNAFVVSMNSLVITQADMDAKYNIIPGGNLHMSNSQFNNNVGAAYGKPFIQNTGRVDGWDLTMERVNPDDYTPEFVRSRVEIYETADGASTALSKDWFWAYQLEDRVPDEFLDTSCNLGPDCLTFKYVEAKPGAGYAIERYDVAFRYKNVVAWVFVKGSFGEVSEDLALQYGQLMLDKIKLLEE